MKLKHLVCLVSFLFVSAMVLHPTLVRDFGPELPRPDLEKYCEKFEPYPADVCPEAPPELLSRAATLRGTVQELNENQQKFCESTGKNTSELEEKNSQTLSIGSLSNVAYTGSGITGCTQRAFVALTEHVRIGQEIQLRFLYRKQELLKKKIPKSEEAIEKNDAAIKAKIEERDRSTSTIENLLMNCVENCDGERDETDRRPQVSQNSETSATDIAAMTQMTSGTMGNFAQLPNLLKKEDSPKETPPAKEDDDSAHEEEPKHTFTPPSQNPPGTPPNQGLASGQTPRNPCWFLEKEGKKYTSVPMKAGESPNQGETLVSGFGVRVKCVPVANEPGGQAQSEEPAVTPPALTKAEPKVQFPEALKVEEKKPGAKKEPNALASASDYSSTGTPAPTAIAQPGEKKPEEVHKNEPVGFTPKTDIGVLADTSGRRPSSSRSAGGGGRAAADVTEANVPLLNETEAFASSESVGGFQDFIDAGVTAPTEEESTCPPVFLRPMEEECKVI